MLDHEMEVLKGPERGVRNSSPSKKKILRKRRVFSRMLFAHKHILFLSHVG